MYGMLTKLGYSDGNCHHDHSIHTNPMGDHSPIPETAAKPHHMDQVFEGLHLQETPRTVETSKRG